MHHVGVEGAVVVAEEEERGALDHAQRLVAGRGVARPAGQQAHEGIGQDPAHPCRRVGSVAGDQDQDRELLVVLAGQGDQRLFQPWTRPGGHNDRDHCRYLGVHQVLEANRFRSADQGLATAVELLATV